MRRFLCKPCIMRVKDYAARVVEINSYISDFPPVNATTPATMLGDNELIDLLEFGIPVRWQKYMVMQRFDPLNGTIKEFSKFCELLEDAMDDNKVTPEKKKRVKLQKFVRKNPQANAILKRAHQMIGNILCTFQVNDTNVNTYYLWSRILSAVIFAMHSTVHTTMQATPMQLIFGCDAKTNLSFDANWHLIK